MSVNLWSKKKKKKQGVGANNPRCMYSGPHAKLNAMQQHSMD